MDQVPACEGAAARTRAGAALHVLPDCKLLPVSVEDHAEALGNSDLARGKAAGDDRAVSFPSFDNRRLDAHGPAPISGSGAIPAQDIGPGLGKVGVDDQGSVELLVGTKEQCDVVGIGAVVAALASHPVRNVQSSPRLEADRADFVFMTGIVQHRDDTAFDLEAIEEAQVSAAGVGDARHRAALEREPLRAPELSDFGKARPEFEIVVAVPEIHSA